ncbi:DUF924 family protein [Altererythrobacter aquaemixtae]|uniref:DUF924 family protein n=2 Tax=Pontixanthobacter aquaemixtae TaxID=1958940 RepID=A0A844ZY27_9SPHN|nr:DUF924 family protein [Pontixanthobacter aquaemixtae]
MGELLHFWFEELEPSDWFGSSDSVDSALRQRFEDVLDKASAHKANAFLTDARSAQAAILLFDQVPRNIYRGTARAFAFDPLAREIAKGAIARGWDTALPDKERQFVAMPLMHSEDLADQEASLAYFSEHLPDNRSFAESHHKMIAQFGRFPHRNDVLGRKTTAAEQRAIDDGNSW